MQYARGELSWQRRTHAGDVLTARQLLEGMLLPSGADAAYLLATSYGPGWRAFVRKMNAKARKLGMTQTHFANFDGLPWPTPTATYSSPRDLIIMGKAAMKRAGLPADRRPAQPLVGRDQPAPPLLLDEHRPAARQVTPVRSASRQASPRRPGYCLLFDAKRGGKELMGVVLDSTSTDASSASPPQRAC